MTTTTTTENDGVRIATDRGGGPARIHLLRMREFVRGHGVASAAEVKAALGLKAARSLARQTDRGEFVLLARGVSGIPGTTTDSPEYHAFLERRRAAAASGTGRCADRLVAWAAARDGFGASDALAEFGPDASGILTRAVRRGDIVRTGRGRYACRAAGARIARARRRLPAADVEKVRALAARTGVFAVREIDLPPGDPRLSVLASMVLRGEVVRLGRSLYARPGLDADSPEADACRRRLGPSSADRMEDWARAAGVFTVPEAIATLGATARTMVSRRLANGTVERVGRGLYRWVGGVDVAATPLAPPRQPSPDGTGSAPQDGADAIGFAGTGREQEKQMPTIKRPRNPDAPATGAPTDSIDNLVLQGRAHYGLRSALIDAEPTDDGRLTVGEAAALSDEDIMRAPNVGRKSLRDIRSEIARYLGG